MKTHLLTLALIVIVTTTLLAQDVEPKSAELQVLDRYVGTWEETAITKPALWTPEQMTSTTTTTRKWILDGTMIENKGKWSPLDIAFLHLMTYDEANNEYRQWYFDKGNLGGQSSRGSWNEATQTFTFVGSLSNAVATKGQQHFIDDDTFTWTLIAKDESGKVVLDMEGKCVRKK